MSTCGLCFKTEKNITKNDIITICKVLNSKYSDCEFTPEKITEGGIVYTFKDKKWYKSVRLCVNYGETRGMWYHVNNDVMTEWCNNNEIIFKENITFSTVLKSYHGAPAFTRDELNIWEECFMQVGILRVGKYPSRHLKC
jgi:hypothetical protein